MKPKKKLNIAIVGCGTAGSSAALFLKQSGHHISLFEKIARPEAVGAGILLQPSGMAVLERLDLLKETIDYGARVERLYGTNHIGKSVLDIKYDNYKPGCYGLGIHRGSLFQILHNALIKNQIELNFGYEIQSFIERADGSILLQDKEGRKYGPFDMVVIADGARSTLRDKYYPKRKVIPYQWGALWTICHDPLNKFDGCLRQVYHRARKMIGVLPTGKIPGDSKNLVSLFWSIRIDQLQTWQQKGLIAWKEEVLTLWPELVYLLDGVNDPNQLIFANYSDVRVYPWHKQRIVLIGDAAHATSPQLGQGANLALYDAMILAECLNQDNTIELALSNYSRLRRAHLNYYQMASHWLTPFFQSNSSGLGILRDLTMEQCCRYWPMRNHMLDTLVGVKSGVFKTIKLNQ